MKALQGINAAARIGIELGNVEARVDAEIDRFVDAVVLYVAEVGDGVELPEAYLGLADYQIDQVLALHGRSMQLRAELTATAH